MWIFWCHDSCESYLKAFPYSLHLLGFSLWIPLMQVKIWRLIEISATFTTFITYLFYRGPDGVVRYVLTPLLPSNFLAIPSLSMGENLWSWTVKSMKSFFSVVSYSSGFSKLFLKWECWEASPSYISVMSLEDSGSLGILSFGVCSSFSVLVLPLVLIPLGASPPWLSRPHGTFPYSSWNIRSGFGNGNAIKEVMFA